MCARCPSRRKGELKALLKRAPFGLALNDYVAGDGPALFAQPRAMGVVSKRRGSPYRSGRSPHWVKAKNPGESGDAPRGVRGLGQETPMSEFIITVRDWRRRPPLQLHMRRIKNPASPAMQRVRGDRF